MNNNTSGTVFYNGTMTAPLYYRYMYDNTWEEEEITVIKRTKGEETEEITITKRKRKSNPYTYTTPTYVPYTPWYTPTVTITGNEQPCMFDNWDWKKNPVAFISCPCPKHSIIC